MRGFITLLFVLTFTGCSFKSPPDIWRYESKNAFESYIKNRLSGNNELAQSDYKRALSHAKRGADIPLIATLALGRCSIEYSLSSHLACEDYLSVASIGGNSEHHAFYALLQKRFTQEQTLHMPKQYRAFAQALLIEEHHRIESEILDMEPITSKIIAARIVEESLSKDTLEKIVESAAFYGYKESVIHFLNVKTKRFKEDNDKKRVEIIESK